MTLKTVLPELSEEGKFQEWFGLTIDEGTWEEIFDTCPKKIRKNNEESEGGDETAEGELQWSSRARATESGKTFDSINRIRRIIASYSSSAFRYYHIICDGYAMLVGCLFHHTKKMQPKL